MDAGRLCSASKPWVREIIVVLGRCSDKSHSIFISMVLSDVCLLKDSWIGYTWNLVSTNPTFEMRARSESA